MFFAKKYYRNYGFVTIIKLLNETGGIVMKMYKMILVSVLTFGLLSSWASVVSAEMLFGIGAATGQTDFTAEYRGTYATYGLQGTSDKQNSLTANLELNLFLTRIYIDASKTSFSDSNFYKLAVSAGWELGPDILQLNLFAGGKGYIFEDRSNAADVRNVFYALGGGLGVESELGKLKLYGNVFLPVITKYTNEYINGDEDDSSPNMSYLEAGLSYTTVPFVNIFVNYRKESATADVMKFDSTTYSAGIRVSL
jgi:hypothetical protein